MFRYEKFQLNDITIYFIRYENYKMEDFLCVLNEEELIRLNDFKSEKRKFEFLSTRILKEEIFPGCTIAYTKDGAPFIQDQPNISVSHTANCSAIAVCPSHIIGLDIEPISEKARKLHSKFLNETEQHIIDTSDSLLMTKAWSCKESMYKLSNRKGIIFKRDLEIIACDGKESFSCRILKGNEHFYINLTSMLVDNLIITINHSDFIQTDD